MEIGAARDQIVRCLQRLTLSFVVGDDVIRSRVHRAIEELTMLAEYLPTELPKPSFTPPPPAPAPEVPAVDLTGPIMPMTNPPTPQPDYTPPSTTSPTVTPQPEPIPYAIGDQPPVGGRAPFIVGGIEPPPAAPLAGEHHGDYIDPGPVPLAEATPNAPSTVEHTSTATFRAEAFIVPGVFVTTTPAEPQPTEAPPAGPDAPYVRP